MKDRLADSSGGRRFFVAYVGGVPFEYVKVSGANLCHLGIGGAGWAAFLHTWHGRGTNLWAVMIQEEPKRLTEETITTLRTLAHELSNAIENVMQASYLLSQAKLDENSAKWLELIDSAAGDAARINREIREILRTHS